MTIEYSELSADQQRQMLKGRLAQFEAEHYGTVINLAVFKANGLKGDLENAERNLSQLEKAIYSVKAMISALPEEEPEAQVEGDGE